MANLLQSLNASDNVALILPADQDITISFARLRSLIDKLSRKLTEAGMKSGDICSMSMSNSVEFVLTFFAVTSIGCAVAPLNPAYKANELEFYLNDTQSNFVLVAKRRIKMLGHVWTVAENKKLNLIALELSYSGQLSVDVTRLLTSERSFAKPPYSPSVALLLHTSGTTSKPKCVPLTHQNILQTMKNVSKTYQLSMDDRTLLVMPLFHVHGLIGALLSTLSTGGSVVVVDRFSASLFWSTFSRYACTWYSAVPTIHQMLLRTAAPSREQRRSLRFIRSCSAALAPTILEKMELAFGVPVLEAYAMTEAAHQISSNPYPPATRKPGSVGVGQNVEVCIFDDTGKPCKLGEVCIRGKNVFSGYLNRPDANSTSFISGGWFRTGDQGYLDGDGYIFLTGRIKELINRGGEKISPLEVDNVFLGHPFVQEFVAFGVPDPIYGEEIEAAVVVRKGETLRSEDLVSFCREKLALFKCPKRFHFVSQLPRTPTGKIQRRVVAEQFIAKKSKL